MSGSDWIYAVPESDKPDCDPWMKGSPTGTEISDSRRASLHLEEGSVRFRRRTPLAKVRVLGSATVHLWSNILTVFTQTISSTLMTRRMLWSDTMWEDSFQTWSSKNIQEIERPCGSSHHYHQGGITQRGFAVALWSNIVAIGARMISRHDSL